MGEEAEPKCGKEPTGGKRGDDIGGMEAGDGVGEDVPVGVLWVEVRARKACVARPEVVL